MSHNAKLPPSLDNPFEQTHAVEFVVPGQIGYEPGLYEEAMKSGQALIDRPRSASGVVSTEKQHLKHRMTVWERLEVLADSGTEPTVLFQNWGPNLDGASLVTAIVQIDGRPVAVYGHDFTVRAGSMDATNGRKLANLFELAGKLYAFIVTSAIRLAHEVLVHCVDGTHTIGWKLVFLQRTLQLTSPMPSVGLLIPNT